MAVLPRQPAPLDRPLPLRLIFPLLFVGVYLAHLTLLRLPYYWDEAGYYIPAAYDFFRTGDVIPSTTLANAHPPLPSLYLALWWKSGFTPAVTRTAMCLITAIALLAVYRLAILLNGRPWVAATTTVLTAIYPVWFAQSTLAHADMFAAAATLWGLVFVFSGHAARRMLWAAAACFAVATWCKETAIVTPLAIALWELYLCRRSSPTATRPLSAPGCSCSTPILPLLAWYAYYRHRTGFLFGNPEFLRYNATSTLSPLRILLALAHRILQLTAHMNMFVPVLCMLGAMLLLPLRERGRNPAAAHLAAGPGHSLCRHGGQYPLLFRDRGRSAYPLSAAPLSADSAAVRLHLLPPCALLVGTGPADRGRFSDRAVRQPALQVRPRRQPELCRCDPSASTGDPADCDPLSREHDLDRLAGHR